MAASKKEVNRMDENRSKALAAALSQIEKQFGKGSIMRLGEKEVAKDLDVVSTGSLGLDLALGIGGLPRGRVVEIYGPGIVRQDHADAVGDRADAENRRHCRIHRRRACARSAVRTETRLQRFGTADLATRQRRTGARDRRHAGALRLGGRGGGRLGGGTDAEGRNRRRDGRAADGAAGAADVAGAAESSPPTSSAPTRW